MPFMTLLLSSEIYATGMEPNSKTILVVDDSNVTLHFISELLKCSGYKVLTARNGKQAIASIDNHLIDIVLLDLMMPVISGFEVLARIKSNTNYNALPIMIVSACCDQENIEKAMKMGASAYFTKPLVVEDLLKQVKFQLESVAILNL